MAVAVEVSVSGRVQGVAFRAYAAQEAGRLGVTGWLRNEPDGSVTGHFEGDGEAVDALVEWCRAGPRLAWDARGTRFYVEAARPDGGHDLVTVVR